MILGLVLLIGVVCMVAAPAQAGVVVVSNAHASVTLPSGWTYQRNYTESSATFDLYITATVTGGLIVGMFAHQITTGSVDSQQLWDELRGELEGEGYTGITYVVEPRNITVGGMPACDATISASGGMLSANERITMAYSEDWHMTYVFIFAVVSTAWSQASSNINSVIMSLSVDEKAGGTDSPLLWVGAAVAAAAVVVVVLLMMRKKKAQAMVPPMAPPLASSMMPPPPGPPPMQ